MGEETLLQKGPSPTKHFNIAPRLTGDSSQGLSQKGQSGGIALVFALHIVHIPQHPHHVAPVAGLLEGPQAGGQAQSLDGCGAHNHHAPCAEARGSRPEGVGVRHKAFVRAGGAVFRRGGHASGPEGVGSGRVSQILKQFLQEAPAFKAAFSLRVAEIKTEIPVGPQHQAGPCFFQLLPPGRGPHMGRQGLPRVTGGSVCLHVSCGLARRAIQILPGLPGLAGLAGSGGGSACGPWALSGWLRLS